LLNMSSDHALMSCGICQRDEIAILDFDETRRYGSCRRAL
jgi:hypothetical protein